jgi:hypothetical protein
MGVVELCPENLMCRFWGRVLVEVTVRCRVCRSRSQSVIGSIDWRKARSQSVLNAGWLQGSAASATNGTGTLLGKGSLGYMHSRC